MHVVETQEWMLNSLSINQMIFITLNQTTVATVGQVNSQKALVFLFTS